MISIGIKHFSCINIPQFPREMVKTESKALDFQLRDLLNFNALKKNRLLLLQQFNDIVTLIYKRYGAIFYRGCTNNRWLDVFICNRVPGPASANVVAWKECM